jgi:hypothetical protein
VRRLVIPAPDESNRGQAAAGIQESRVGPRLRGSDDAPLRSRVKPKRRARLALEIAVVLVVKFCALWLIWWVWFSDSGVQEVDGERIGAKIYSSTPAAPVTQKDSHAPRH